MVRLNKQTAGEYGTNIIAVNSSSGQEERVFVRRRSCGRLWSLQPLVEELGSRSECKNLLERLISSTKRYDEWMLKYDPNYVYTKPND